MATKHVATLMDNIGARKPDKAKFTSNAYWISGPDARNKALEQYDLQRTGYVRMFVLQLPKFVEKLLPDESAMFKHMLEYGNVGIDGIQGYSVETTQATGGYAGASIEFPTGTKDDTSGITVKMYDTIESLVRTYVDFWITGTFDPQTGLSHYHGAREILASSGKASAADLMYFSQANHTMEVLIVATDPTGEIPLYSCLIANMFPKSSDHSHYNFDPGSHELVQMNLEFTGTKYMSSQINYLGAVALRQFKIMKNFMLMYSGYSATNTNGAFKAALDDSRHSISEWFQKDDGGSFTGTNNAGNAVNRTNSGWHYTDTEKIYGINKVESTDSYYSGYKNKK